MRGNLRNGSNAGLANSNLRNDVSNARWNYALAIFIFRLDGGNVVFRTDEPCCRNMWHLNKQQGGYHSYTFWSEICTLGAYRG